ncbi:MAG: hypothetical protein ABI467_02495 [Kofleriaceae bacterium]
MRDLRWSLVSACALVFMSGCSSCDSPAGRTYYERNIEPILQQKCAGNTSGCHSTNADDPYQFAAGNFDVTSFDNVQKRRDVLTRFGPYPQPLLLIKAIAPEVPDPLRPSRLQFQYGTDPSDPTGNTPAFRDIEVLHAGGGVIDLNSDAYLTLQTWLENGATANGLKPPTPALAGNGACSTAVPPGFTAATAMMNPKYAAGFDKFKSDVMPILKGCASSNCHGAPQSDFYITCGDDDNQLAFNFTQAWSFVNEPVDDSQLLRVPLAVASGGRGHAGGDQYPDTDDSDYNTIRNWAAMVGLLDFANGDPVKQYFKDNVQPILIARGCQFQACHSPAATNDFKLRPGTEGFFSAVALEKNYDLMKDDFMAMEFPDSRRGRAIAKTLLANDPRTTTVGGISHRGGPVLETPGLAADPAGTTIAPTTPACTTAPSSTTPFCIIQKWVDLERAAMSTELTPMNAGDTIPIVYVDRPAGQTAGPLEFDTFQGGADLRVVTATFGADYGRQLTVDNATQTSLITNCAGLGATPDIGRPSVKNDGDTVAFAGRASAAAGWRIYTVSIATKVCTPVASGATGAVSDFDPSWSPDNLTLLFASTRGKNGIVETRVAARPQSDIWRMQMPSGTPEQVTFLSNSEVNPQTMREGRIIMSAEKASNGFYQVSGRRMNWDRSDYHPLLAQRAMSNYPSPTDLTDQNPSFGYSQATYIREGSDGNFLVVLSDSMNGVPVLKGGAGALATFNRSIGPFEQGRTDAGYLHSLRILGSSAETGHAGATAGFRSPMTMPDGQILVSHTSLPGLAWDIVLLDPRTSVIQSLGIAATNGAVLDAVLAYKYPPREVYQNRRQLVFGGTISTDDPTHAVIYMPDAPMVFTVLTGNLRRGRPVDDFRKAKYLAVYSEGMCPAGSCPRTTNGIYESRTLIGKSQLADDGSAKVRLPAAQGVVLELQDDAGNSIVKMTEEHQLGPGEQISMGVRESFTNPDGTVTPMFDAVCGGCHGSVTGHELDVVVTPDALTGASQSIKLSAPPDNLGN